MPETVKTYLEFRDSNWYAYWDMDSPPVIKRQVLQVWHINLPEQIMEFHYRPLKMKVSAGEFVKDLMEIEPSISYNDALDLQAAAICFIRGVESKYPV